MHRVAIVALQSADRAIVSNLVRPQEHLHQPKEQGDAANHDDDGDQVPQRPGEGDIAETGRGQRRDREIERVDIVSNGRVGPVLRLVDKARHDEDEDAEIDRCPDQVFVTSKKYAVGSQPREKLVGVEQAQGSQDAQEADALSHDGREE